MSYDYDIAIIGGGPGGYCAAIRAAQLGFRVVLIDKQQALGGTCLHTGCIPSKILLHGSAEFHGLKHIHAFGIHVKNPTINISELMAYKRATIDGLAKGIDSLFALHSITHITGEASFLDEHTLSIGKSSLTATTIIIATGSSVTPLDGITPDGKTILDSTDALSLTKIPHTLAIIGGGYIGLELGSVWARLGSTVTIVEYSDAIGTTLDADVAQVLRHNLEDIGITFLTHTEVTHAEKFPKSIKLTLKNRSDQSITTATFTQVLLSIGRTPYTANLNLQAVGIACDDRGFIPVDQENRTSIPHIYAIGDVVKGLMLAHRASDEGVTLVERLKGHKVWTNPQVIPSVMYTNPEVAQVGKTETQCLRESISYTIGKFPLTANSRARAVNMTGGFVKILTNPCTDRVIGGTIIGAHAGELIGEIALGMEMGASSEDIARTCHAHPTLSEAVREASLQAFDKAIHIP
ncbi:MAG: dihydrolipoyl dehydrogenase [Alphaproteobacteria bacterium]|nr:MAG: dihydrolipoyl dehydrogenase [Alphaproteobacteria bacterium]